MQERTFPRTLTHTGSEVGSDNVSLSTNSPNSETPVVEWTVPRKFDEIAVRGSRHETRAVLRTKEVFSGDGATTTFALASDLIPVAGEENLDEQPTESVVAAVAGAEVSVASVDYISNEVTLDSAPATGTDNVQFFPLVTEGTVKAHALDQFGHDRGSLETWGVGLHVFADFDTLRQDTQIHLPSAGDFAENEKLALYVDSPQTVVWTDADYPRGQYASTVSQGVDVTLKGK